MGTAWDTDPGRLGVRRIIHVAVLDVHGRSSLETIGAAATSALAFAEKYRFMSVALPIMGSGTAGLDYNSCVRTLTGAAHRHFLASPTAAPRDVVLVLFSPSSFEHSIEAARQAIS
jgi:O-acetyl-ADP-ribose deacetylase (regulator of RNase III)